MSDTSSKLRKEQIYRKVSGYYARYLNSLDWSDQDFLDLQVLMRNKFMTLAYYKFMGGKNHRTCSEWVSSPALETLKGSPTKARGQGLWLEHIVPKQKYITVYCEKLASSGTITQEQVFEVMEMYFHLATITKEENQRLDELKLRNQMPDGWLPGNSVFARYELAGLKLERNPYFLA